jgi:hypothetical protein
MATRGLSGHILPNSTAMVGVCVTAIGLVKILEGRIGPSHVDEYCALTAIIFAASAILSYVSIRMETMPNSNGVIERLADFCFMLGLAALTGIALLFAYEVI